MAAGYGQGMWGNGQRVVEELGTGDDTDTQGVGLASGKRFSSDPLRFTGIDVGEGMVRSRRRPYEQSDDDDDDTPDSDQDSELDAESETQLALREKENALVESALRRIRRAQAKGRQEVKLNKKELAALETRRKRMQAEAGGSKKKKEQRYAVPLSQLGPISQKENQALIGPDDTLPPHPSPGTFERTQEGRLQPPVGWFAHPQSSRPGTADSRESRRSSGRASDRELSSSPFQYSYVQPSSSPSNPRHSSDPSLRHRSSRGPMPREESWMLQYGASASTSSIPSANDPFRYMTSGPQAPYHTGAAVGPRNFSTSSVYLDPRADNASRRQSRQILPDDTESEDSSDEGDTSDDAGAGARIGSSNVGPSSGRDQIIVEEEREPTPPPRPVTRSKKTTSATSSPKRKPVGGGNGRKKKGSK
jgi:PRA1 family protein 1